MSTHIRYINLRKYHFKQMMHGYGVGDKVPLTVARIYYSIATDRADKYFENEISMMDRLWAMEVSGGRYCTTKEILEIKEEINHWIDEKEQMYG